MIALSQVYFQDMPLTRKLGLLADLVVASRKLSRADMDSVVIMLREAEKALLKAEHQTA